MRTDSEQMITWLTNAMSASKGNADEHYYYDSRRNDFFSTYKDASNPYIVYLNTSNVEFAIDIGIDLAVRMEFINDDSSDLTEIPRFTINEKISIQLEFLSKMPGTYWHNELIAAIEKQQDDHKFVLDTVLIENDNSAPMASYWFDYKLNYISESITRFSQFVDL